MEQYSTITEIKQIHTAWINLKCTDIERKKTDKKEASTYCVIPFTENSGKSESHKQ